MSEPSKTEEEQAAEALREKLFDLFDEFDSVDSDAVLKLLIEALNAAYRRGYDTVREREYE